MFSDEKWAEIAAGMARESGTPTTVEEAKSFAEMFDGMIDSKPPPGHYVDRDGNELTLGEYHAYRYSNIHVGLDRVTDMDAVVSTVWNGNAWMGWVFETMVQIGGKWDETLSRHYATEAEAVEGHAGIVARLEARARN